MPACLARTRNVACEGVLGGVGIVEGLHADPEDHRAVPLDQGRERGFADAVPASEEPVDQLAVAQVPDGPGVEQVFQMAGDAASMLIRWTCLGLPGSLSTTTQ